MTHSNAHLFRAMAREEDAMARKAMPRTAAADPVIPAATRRLAETIARVNGSRLVRPLTATISERVA